MKKIILALGLTALIASGISAQEKINIDTDFVKESSSVSYNEWTGGYAPEEINTGWQIMDIGRRLGNGIKYQETVQNDPNPFNKGNPAYKYSAARIYSEGKRGADVILIGHTATVDTIKCLKLILRCYLETAFNYSPEESKVLAEKICWWNTNKYNDFSYFNTQFQDGITKAFEGKFEHIGLSSSYKDWKGSVLVIPHTFTGASETVSVDESAIVEEPEETPEPAFEVEPQAEVQQEEPAQVYETPVQTPAKKSFPVKIVLLIAAGVLVLGAIILLLLKFLS